MSQSASGPAPKTIGMGPTKTTPPTLPDPPKNTEATTSTAMPMKTSAIPKNKKPSSRPDNSMPSSSFFSSLDIFSYLSSQYFTTKSIKTTTVSANANASTALTDFLSVPKTMGTGPIMITPAPRTLPFFAPLLDTMMIAATITMIPTTIKAVPSA